MNTEERIESFKHYIDTFDMFKKMMLDRMISHHNISKRIDYGKSYKPKSISTI
jgi:hypothetical protein